MSKYTWKEVEWSNEVEFLTLLLNNRIYLMESNSSPYVEFFGPTVTQPFQLITTGRTLVVDGSGNHITFEWFQDRDIGYIKKEADWTDVISEDNPIFLITKAGSIARYVCAPIENTKFRPATLNEVRFHIWECMQDE